jgi:hypothetical protein
MLIWGINQDDPVCVDQALKNKVDALDGTNITKTCRYVEVACLQRVKTTHNTQDN